MYGPCRCICHQHACYTGMSGLNIHLYVWPKKTLLAIHAGWLGTSRPHFWVVFLATRAAQCAWLLDQNYGTGTRRYMYLRIGGLFGLGYIRTRSTCSTGTLWCSRVTGIRSASYEFRVLYESRYAVLYCTLHYSTGSTAVRQRPAACWATRRKAKALAKGHSDVLVRVTSPIRKNCRIPIA